ncbi:MAG TPA: hypothetical protein VGJ04_09855 [Pirellulales bacterium]
MATTTARKENKTKAHPCHKIRVGTTTASIWSNEGGDNGRTFYNTTIIRSYKNDAEEYVETNSYLDSQLLELSQCALLANSWIVERQAEDRAERRG